LRHGNENSSDEPRRIEDRIERSEKSGLPHVNVFVTSHQLFSSFSDLSIGTAGAGHHGPDRQGETST